jgi:two-component system, OmpR family, phosphate regulon sensor histidine kinase PhoR
MNFNERLAYLGELLISLSGSPIPSHQFQALADYAPTAIACDYLAVCLLNPDGDGYRIHSLYGLAGGAVPQRSFAPDEGLVGHVLQRNRTIVAENLGEDERGAADVEKTISRLGLQTALVTPLRQGQTPLGALYFAAKTAGSYQKEDVQLANLLAAGLSSALETTRLYQALADERSTMAAVMASNKDAMLVVNPQGFILMANPAVNEMFGLEAGDIAGQSLYQAVDNLALRRLFDHAEPGMVEIPIVNGRTAQANLSPVITPYGEQLGWAATFRDISLLKELEQMKNEFVNTVSHDLKNPISSMMLAADLLPRAGQLTARQEEIRFRLLDTARYMNELVEDLLDLGKIEAGLQMERQPFDVSRPIFEVAEQLLPQAEAKRIQLQLQIPEAEVIAVGNRDRIKQALFNLVGNAIKYTPEGGKVEVRMNESAPSPQLPQPPTGAERLVMVHIADTGYGIPADSLPFLFDKFYRVQDAKTDGIKGTGLGLAITRKIIEAHDGRIWVESAVGEGSVFSFYLPG